MPFTLSPTHRRAANTPPRSATVSTSDHQSSSDSGRPQWRARPPPEEFTVHKKTHRENPRQIGEAIRKLHRALPPDHPSQGTVRRMLEEQLLRTVMITNGSTVVAEGYV